MPVERPIVASVWLRIVLHDFIIVEACLRCSADLSVTFAFAFYHLAV